MIARCREEEEKKIIARVCLKLFYILIEAYNHNTYAKLKPYHITENTPQNACDIRLQLTNANQTKPLGFHYNLDAVK